MYGIQFGFKCICSVSGADFLFQFLKDRKKFQPFFVQTAKKTAVRYAQLRSLKWYFLLKCFVVGSQIPHQNQVVGHQRRIFAHIIAIGRAALEDEVCGVEIGAGQVLGDDQHLAPAGQDSVADVGVSGQIAVSYTHLTLPTICSV